MVQQESQTKSINNKHNTKQTGVYVAHLMYLDLSFLWEMRKVIFRHIYPWDMCNPMY